jgi:hypothetical protein
MMDNSAKSQAVTAARFATMRRRDEKIRHVKGEVTNLPISYEWRHIILLIRNEC